MLTRSTTAFSSLRWRLILALVGGALLGAGVAALSPGAFWPGWLAASVLAVPALFLLAAAWTWAGGGRLLAWMIALAFLLRLVAGVGLSLALPEWGYDTDCQNAGYLFIDACERDREAFGVAQKGEGLYWFSGIKLDTDQYGGLAFLSGWIYRYLSPDAHRPFLVLIVGAFFAALGTPFLYRAISLRWNGRVAGLAAWIYVLYPDALFFASAQMREPILAGLGAVAFWAVLAWERRPRAGLAVFAASLLGMAFFSPRVALMVAGVLLVWFWLEFSASRPGPRWQVLGWFGLAGGLLAMLILTWGWFLDSAAYDIQVTIQRSGWLAKIIEEAGQQWALPVLTVYGLAQPVLPAALTETSIPLWQSLGIFRAAGWYALAPFLVYGLFTVWKEPLVQRRRILIWLVLAVCAWLAISTLRGGGDQTDNPRYRSLFLPWLALLAAWAVDRALALRDAWLWRWILVEGIFLGFFTHWYVSRYLRIAGRLPFWQMLAWILFLSGLVLAGGWLYDRLRAGRRGVRLFPW
jgi:hypothetical protein